MNLNFNPSQVYVATDQVLTPLVSNWQFSSSANAGYPNFIFMKNQPQSGLFQYQIRPKNSFSIWSFQGYTQMKIITEVIYPSGYPNPFILGSPLIPQTNYTSQIANTWHNLSIGISPSLMTTAGLHTIIIKFKIVGTKNNIQSVLSTYDFPVNVHVFEEGVYNSPLNFTFFKSANPTPNQTLVVGGSDWILNIPKGLKLTSTQVTVTPTQIGGYTASGSGNKTFQLGLNTNIGEVIGFEETTNLNAVINYVGQNANIPITVIQTGDYFPLSLSFQVSSGFVNHDFQIITINKLGEITLSYSDFLSVELIVLGEQRLLKVMIIDPDNFGPGEFDGEIYMTVDTSSYLIPIRVLVNNNFDVGIVNDSIPFTKTMNDLEFQSTYNNTYINIDFTTNQTSDVFNYKIPFINGICKKNIGRVMDRLINFSNEDLNNFNVNYNLPVFNLILNEIQNQQSVVSFSKNNIPVMKGYEPLVINKSAILQHNSTSRFTPNSFALISLLSGTGTYQYKILKNGVEAFISSELYGYVSTNKLSFSDFDAVAGDTFDFVFILPGQELKKTFFIFPETENSFDIVYEDSFGLKSVLNFTGSSFQSVREIDHIFELHYNRSELYRKKVNVSDEKTISLNTGFILESQILEVDELLESEKAWLYINGEKKLTLVPKTQKITTRDSENFLINYSVEFYINIENYAQNYRF